MILTAIDPGTTQSAWVTLDDQFKLLDFGKDDNDTLLQVVANAGREHDSRIACEMIASYGMPVGREVFETCVWIGRFKQIASDLGVPFQYVYRKDEKLEICGNPRAKDANIRRGLDANIRRGLIERFARFDFQNGRGTEAKPDYFYGFKADMWAAMAVAVTWMHKHGIYERW